MQMNKQFRFEVSTWDCELIEAVICGASYCATTRNSFTREHDFETHIGVGLLLTCLLPRSDICNATFGKNNVCRSIVDLFIR